MSHKKVMLVFILVLGLSLLSISAFAQGEDLGERVMIYPWEIWDGEITVSTDDTVVLGARWGACTKGLAQAWTRTAYINYSLDGEPLFSSQKEAREYWGRPYSVMNPEPENCVNGSEKIWIVAWEYELEHLNEGDYQVHFEMGTTHPFHDGFDSDGDGKPDPQVFDIQFDFAINVIAAGAISGTVTEDEGDPLEGLDVVACQFDDPDICVGAVTDADGSYSIYPVPEGDYRVFVYQQGYWMEEFYDHKPIWDLADPVTVIAGQETGWIDFDLVMGGSISGFVTDEFTGDGIEGLDVLACVFDAEDLCFWGAMTEPDGSYSIRGIPADTYRVFVYQQDYWMEEFYDDKPIWDWANQVTVIAGQDTPEIDFDLVMGGSISGFVTDAETDEGIDGLDVIACVFYAEDLCFWGAMTEPDGSYSIRGIPADTYRVFVYQQGDWMEEFYNDQLFWDDADPIEVFPGGDTGGINFALSEMTIISGRVTNAHDGEGIPDLWVDSCHESVLIDVWGQSPLCNGDYTDENGYYAISVLQEGNYRLVIWDPNWIAEFYDDVLDYDSATLVLALGGQETGGIDFELEQTGSISGRVTNAHDGEGIPDLWVDSCHESVLIDVWGQSPLCNGDYTDEDGYYSISILQEGKYRLVIWDPSWVAEFYADAPNYDLASLVFAIGGQETGGINFELQRAGSISGTITDLVGDPIVGIGVGACQFYVVNEPACYGAETNSSGEYTMYGLIPDAYLVFVSGQAGWVDERFEDNNDTPVLVEAGQDTGEIYFTLTPVNP